MSCLRYHNAELFIEDVSLRTVAEKFGTPCYVYSRAALEENWRKFNEAFHHIPHRICYAVKANSNIAILNIFARLSSGFDIVSYGELERVIAAGGDRKKIIFSGVGKMPVEIQRAIEAGIYCFNIESEPELERINAIASSLNTVVNIALRINPNVDPNTHTHISTGLNENKFGINLDEIMPICQKLSTLASVRLIGIASHIGSQITDIKPFIALVDILLDIYHQLKKININLEHINVGGGLGIVYRDEKPPSIHEYANVLQKKIAGLPIQIILEPGRSVVGNAGILLTRIEYIKHTRHKNFAIVDAGMNDLMRPALYDAWQAIVPVDKRDAQENIYDVVGPVCESSDFLGKDRKLAILPGELLAVDSAGAYGFSMSSNYNSRCRSPEVLIDKNAIHLIRRRETIDELFAAESLLASVQA